MFIAVMSDSHDNWGNLQRAIDIANHRKAEILLFGGDFMSPPGIEIINKFEGKIIMVWGNNDGEKLGLLEKATQTGKITIAGDMFEGEFEAKKVFMNHFPRQGEIAATSGIYDLVIHGHTHEWRLEKFNNCWLLNPGEIQGIRNGQATMAVVKIEEGRIEIEKIEL